jgi:hypothetical protein
MKLLLKVLFNFVLLMFGVIPKLPKAPPPQPDLMDMMMRAKYLDDQRKLQREAWAANEAQGATPVALDGRGVRDEAEPRPLRAGDAPPGAVDSSMTNPVDVGDANHDR